MPLYAGMTVNERSVISGLIHDWDRAVARGARIRWRAKMIEVLMATELTVEQAASTADATLAKRG
jgi:hypothetical protein